MESFARYLLSRPDQIDRVFVSDPPGPALLIWTNNTSMPDITGISLVRSLGYKENGQSVSSDLLVKILRNQVRNVPFLLIEYAHNMSTMSIDGISYSLGDAANIISSTFKIALGASPAKAPNDPTQISDPFHIWSRGAFHGSAVKKTDIDIVSLTADRTKIKAVVEIKRSSKIPVGRWTPYVNPRSANNDCANFLMMMSLANSLNANMVTIHHEIMDQSVVMPAGQKVDVFAYMPTNDKPTQATLDGFASTNNRKIYEVKDFIK